jgi:predicted DNA-binding transcriptional regulator AlpA
VIQNQTLLIPLDVDALASMMRGIVRDELAQYVPPPPKPPLPEYLTRKEVCDLFRISLPTLHDWERQGVIIPPKVRLNGRVRYRRDEVQTALDKGRGLKHKRKTLAKEGQ